MQPSKPVRQTSANRAAQADPETLVHTDSPDDFNYEGTDHTADTTIPLKSRGDEAYVQVDNPDDFE